MITPKAIENIVIQTPLEQTEIVGFKLVDLGLGDRMHKD